MVTPLRVIETTLGTGPLVSWPAPRASDIAWLLVGAFLRRVLPAANPDFEAAYDTVNKWWVEIDTAGAPQRELGFDALGKPLSPGRFDVLDIKRAGLRGKADAVLLDVAAQQSRILITHDRRTMTRYFRERLAAGRLSTGVFIVPQRGAIGEINGSLLLVWTASQAQEWHDQIVYLPFR
jgi:hypothetical protein